MASVETSAKIPVVLISVALLAVTAYLLRSKPRYPSFSNAHDITASLFERLKWLGGMSSVIMSTYFATSQGTFQYKTLRGRRQVVICSDKLISELKNAPPEALSFPAWTQQMMQVDYTLPLYTGGRDLVHWPSFGSRTSVRFFRSTLNKDLVSTFHRLHADLANSVTPELLHGGHTAHELARKCLIGATARYLVGEPLCLDPVFTEALDNFTYQLGLASQVASLFPAPLKPYAIRYLTRLEQRKTYLFKELRALAKERKCGGYDFFSTGLAALARNQHDETWTVDRLITETCINTLASFHTTSGTLCVILLELVAHPEYQSILREEARHVIAEKGWTLDAMDSLWKLDSFMRETRRYRPISDIILNRLALKDFTFSDGTKVTPGTYVSAVHSPREMDPQYYPNAAEFDGLRFYKLRLAQDGGERYVFTEAETSQNLGFGGGKSACPGRFWASATLKCAVAQVLMEYEMRPGCEKMEYTMTFEEQRLPSMKDRILFKRI